MGRGTSPRGRKPPRWGEILEGYLRQSGLGRRIQEQKILASWEKIVGKAVAENAEPAGVVNEVLRVKVASSVWMQQLQFLKGMVLKRLEENGFPLKGLRFYIGEVNPRVLPGGERGPEEGQGNELSRTQKERIASEVAGIQDEELKQILGRLMAKAAGKGRRPAGG